MDVINKPNVKQVVLSLLLSLFSLGAFSQNVFNTTGNATLGGHNHLSVGNRVYLQFTSSAANGYVRGALSQSIFWDNSLGLWKVNATTGNSDFSLVNFENHGRIVFYSRASSGSSYTMTQAELGNYRRMTILSNGNVGIGTAAPQAKLAVNGNILAKEVKVKTDITVPDYVFEEGYELPDLKELEAYVKQNKHLPEVPSAAEIERDGLDLAAMNLLLLKKVEELTLLLIKKDKKNNDMEGELREIKATLSEMKLERNKEQTR